MENNKSTFIYGLYTKNDKNNIRYVGKSDNPKVRLDKHISATKLKAKYNKKLTYKEHWLVKHNYDVNFIILEECNYGMWSEREIYWISQFNNLTNTSKGGEGGCGIKYKLPIEEVKEWVYENLKPKSKSDWYRIIKGVELPDFIPRDPYEVYVNKGWISWGDYLGTGNIFDNKVNYLTYDKAKLIIKDVGIKTQKEHIKLTKEGKIPENIPNRPERYYKKRGWVSWGDYLGTGNISNQYKEFITYDEFKSEIKKLNIKTLSQFKKLIKGGKMTKNIPTNPNIIYKNNGWAGWYDII